MRMKFDVDWCAATTDPVLNNGVANGSYHEKDGLMHLNVAVKAGSSTTFGSGNWCIMLPDDYKAIFSPYGLIDADLDAAVGGGWIYRNGIRFGGLEVVMHRDTPNMIKLFANGVWFVSGVDQGMYSNFFNASNPFAWGDLDGFSFYATIPVVR